MMDLVVCRFCGSVVSGVALVTLFTLLMSLSDRGISSSVAQLLLN